MNQIVKLVFNLKILPSQIPQFKREIIHLQNRSAHLWHNHVPEEFSLVAGHQSDQDGITIQGSNYRRYPKIQYRVEKLNGQYFACLWGIEEGANALQEFVHSGTLNHFSWNEKAYLLKVLEHRSYSYKYPVLYKADNLQPYTLTHFLPFNERRYQEFKTCYLFSDKLELIESLISDHISLLAEQFGWSDMNPDQLIVRTLDIKGFNTARYLPNNSEQLLRFVSVDMMVGLNCMMPPGISIGNMTSLGYGILRIAKQNRARAVTNVL